MLVQRNPLPGLLLLAGAILSVISTGYEDAENLTKYPLVIVTGAAAVIALCAIAALAKSNPPGYMGAVLVGAMLCGYLANYVVQALYITHNFQDSVVVATAGCVALLLGAGSGLVELGRNYSPAARPAVPGAPAVPGRGTAQTAPAGTSIAPAGWYPDPAGGQGQRYWDGRAWGRTSV